MKQFALLLLMVGALLSGCTNSKYEAEDVNEVRTLADYEVIPVDLSGLEHRELLLPSGLDIVKLDPVGVTFSGTSSFALSRTGHGNQPVLRYLPRGNHLFSTTAGNKSDIVVWNGNDNFGKNPANSAISSVATLELKNADGFYIGRTVPVEYKFYDTDEKNTTKDGKSVLVQVIRYIPPELIDSLSVKYGVTASPRVYPARFMGADINSAGDLVYAYTVGNEVHLNVMDESTLDSGLATITATSIVDSAEEATKKDIYKYFDQDDFIDLKTDSQSKIITNNNGNTGVQATPTIGQEYEIMGTVRDTDHHFTCAGTAHMLSAGIGNKTAIAFNRGVQLEENLAGSKSIVGQHFGRYSLYDASSGAPVVGISGKEELRTLRTNRSCEEFISYSGNLLNPGRSIAGEFGILSYTDVGFIRFAKVQVSGRDSVRSAYMLRDIDTPNNYMQLVAFSPVSIPGNSAVPEEDYSFLLTYKSKKKLKKLGRKYSSIAFFKVDGASGDIYPSDEPLSRVNFIFGDVIGGVGNPTGLLYRKDLQNGLIVWIKNYLVIVGIEKGELIAGPTKYKNRNNGPLSKEQMFNFPDIPGKYGATKVSGWVDFNPYEEDSTLTIYRLPNSVSY